MNHTWMQFNYNAKMAYLTNLKSRATKCGTLINPKNRDNNCSMLEWNDSWVYKLHEIIIQASMPLDTSILIIPRLIQPIVCMSTGFSYNEVKEPIAGPFLLGTTNSLSVVVGPNIDANKIYVYNAADDRVMYIDLV